MPGQKLTGLNEFAGAMADTDLHLYLVDESDQTLDLEGSGYRMFIHKSLVVTDGVNPVQIINGGTIDLGGQSFSVTPGTGGDLVTTDGEQDIANKTFIIQPGEPGPIMNIRDVDLYLYDSVDILVSAQISLANLDNLVAHIYQLPNNDGLSSLVDTEAAQTLANKTLTTPVIVDFSSALHDHRDNDDGGKLDHGLALDGLSDDDHTQYYNQSRGDARYSQTAHDHDARYSQTGHNHDHGALTGKGDDDHTQYHNNSRGDARYSQLAHAHTDSNVVSDRVHWQENGALNLGNAITYNVPSSTEVCIVNFSMALNAPGGPNGGASGSLAFSYSESSANHDLHVWDTNSIWTVGNIYYNGSTHVVTVSAGTANFSSLNLEVVNILK